MVYSFQRANNDDASAFTGHVAGYVMNDGLRRRARRQRSQGHDPGELQPAGIGLIADVWLLCRRLQKKWVSKALPPTWLVRAMKFVEWVKDDYLLMEKWDQFLLSDHHR
ncbi:MAG: hypothetical protein R2856_15785 [Caldilineaceae bacterium]